MRIEVMRYLRGSFGLWVLDGILLDAGVGSFVLDDFSG